MLRRAWLSFVLAGCTAEPAPSGPTAPPPTLAEPRTRAELAAPQGQGAAVGRSRVAAEPPSVCREAVLDRDSSCVMHWTQACDRTLLAAAHRTSEAPARTGACYYHDRTTCPDCACEYYLKVGKLGFDGGTGCLRSLDDVARELRRACAHQRCE